MATSKPFLVFCVGEGRYALDVAEVDRIVFAAELTPVKDAPAHIRGLVNIAGEIIPVIDLRRRLGLPPRDMDLGDRFILTRAGGRPAALLAEAVEGVVNLPVQAVSEKDGAALWSAAAAVGSDGNLVEIYSAEALASARNEAKPAS